MATKSKEAKKFKPADDWEDAKELGDDLCGVMAAYRKLVEAKQEVKLPKAKEEDLQHSIRLNILMCLHRGPKDPRKIYDELELHSLGPTIPCRERILERLVNEVIADLVTDEVLGTDGTFVRVECTAGDKSVVVYSSRTVGANEVVFVQ